MYLSGMAVNGYRSASLQGHSRNQVLLLVLLQLSLSGVRVQGQSACPDEYTYTQQPPTDIVCNPYLNGRLMLDCAVSGSENISIQWYFSQTSLNSFADDTVLIENGTKYLVTPRPIENGIGVSLVVNDLNAENDTGSYWCQATVGPDNMLLTQSGSFELYDPDFYNLIPFSCPTNIFLKNSDTRCAAVVMIEPNEELTTTSITPTPSSSVSIPSSSALPSLPLSSSYSLLSSIESSPLVTATPPPIVDPPPPTNPTEAPDQPPEMSEVISFDEVIFAILGVVVLLMVLCIVLACVIFYLCRKRCRRVDLEGYEKGEGQQSFDEDSTQSVVFRSGVHFKGRSGTNLSIAISNSSRSPNGSGDYAEIGPILMAMRSNAGNLHEYSEIPELPSPRVRVGRNQDENPYDEPGSLVNIEPCEGSLLTQENITSDLTDGESNMENSLSQGYQILERFPKTANHRPLTVCTSDPPTTSPPPPPAGDDDQDDSSLSSPVSPLDYHVLEEPVSNAELQGLVGEDYLYPTISECSTIRLPTIPEHPYHVLETKAMSPPLLRISPEDTGTIGVDVKEATPDFMDPEVSEGPSGPQNATVDFEGREYDRLVSPLRLYHILERSPPESRPRIRGFPSGYDRLDSGRGTGVLSAQKRKGVRFLSPDTATGLSISTGSQYDDNILNPDTQVFDDPQYLVSPTHKVAQTKIDCSEVLRSRRSRAYTTEDIDLTKYCGNYERDPCYMARLHKLASGRNRSKAAEDSLEHPSYASLTEFGLLRGGSSLPDISHDYQCLEAGTREPLQPYERLKRSFLKKETAI